MAERLFDHISQLLDSEGEKQKNQRKQEKRYWIPLIISIIALAIAAVY